MNKGLENFYNLVDAFESLPTIGRKSAIRLAYHITMNDTYTGLKIAHSIENAINVIKKCKHCGAMSEHEVCEICLDSDRNQKLLAIVQNAKDIFVIEESKYYQGKYFVLHELSDFYINKLISYIQKYQVEEILFAITPSLANDAFVLFIEDRLKNFEIKFSKIAQGVPTGVSLENVDILSLAKAIESRVRV